MSWVMFSIHSRLMRSVFRAASSLARIAVELVEGAGHGAECSLRTSRVVRAPCHAFYALDHMTQLPGDPNPIDDDGGDEEHGEKGPRDGGDGVHPVHCGAVVEYRPLADGIGKADDVAASVRCPCGADEPGESSVERTCAQLCQVGSAVANGKPRGRIALAHFNAVAVEHLEPKTVLIQVADPDLVNLDDAILLVDPSGKVLCEHRGPRGQRAPLGLGDGEGVVEKPYAEKGYEDEGRDGNSDGSRKHPHHEVASSLPVTNL